MQVHDYIRIAKRWVPIALILAVVAAVGLYAFTRYTIRPLYTATVTMEVQIGLVSPTVNSLDPSSDTVYAETEAENVAQGPNKAGAAQVALAAQHPPPTQAEVNTVQSSVKCYPHPLTALFSCSATSHDPGFAAGFANALANVFMQREQGWDQSRYQAVLARIATEEQAAQRAGDKARYSTLVQLETSTRLAAAQRATMVRVVSPAAPPSTPSSPHPTLNAVLAFIIVLLLVGAGGIVSDRLDDSIRGTDVLKGLTHLPILGVIPSSDALKDKRLTRNSLIVADSPRTPLAEAFRVARLGITFSLLDAPPRSLVVTSTSEGEGKSTVAANLAAAFAESGKSVILVDLDLRRPAVSEIFDGRALGLTNLLLGATDNPEACLVQAAPNLRILPSGPIPPNPAEVVSSHRMAELLERLQSYADMLIIDSPPVLAAADPAIIASQCDCTVLVVRPDRVKRRALLRTLDILSSGQVRVAGLVVNCIARVDTAYYGAYGHYVSGYAASSGAESPRLVARHKDLSGG